jgi:hypothetical protein
MPRQALEPNPMSRMLMSVHKASLDMQWYKAKTLYSAVTSTSHLPCTFLRVRCCNHDINPLSWSIMPRHTASSAGGVTETMRTTSPVQHIPKPLATLTLPVCFRSRVKVPQNVRPSATLGVFYPRYPLGGGESSC